MNQQSFTVKIDFRIVSLILLLVISAMLAIWQPWNASATSRKISVTGEATVKDVPDEFAFYPYFQRTGDDQAALKKELDEFGNKLLADLKKLGVPEDNIKLNSSAYDYGKPESLIYPAPAPESRANVSLSVTITAANKELAQKIQDYLATTDAQGQITPQATFSKTKQQKIESQARKAALENAREKATQTADTYGAKLGKVIEVKDNAGASTIPWLRSNVAEDTAMSSLPVTPGTNEFTFTVTAIFEIN
jgi:uncharacterized protein